MYAHWLIAGWRRGAAWLSLDGRLRPLRRWALAPGPLLLALTLALPARWLTYIGAVYLLLSLGAYTWLRLAGPRLRLSRRPLSDWSQVGDQIEELWELSSAAALPLPWVEIVDESTLPGYSARRATSLGPGERQSWRTTATCARRGVYRLGPLVARTGDPLGLFVFAWRQPETRTLVVYPPLVRLPPLALPHGRSGGLARADLLQIHTTPSVGGLREYVPGDPPSRIHWPHVARHGRLVIKEFDQERAGALWIVLDLCAADYDRAAAEMPAVLPLSAAPLPGYGRSSVASAAPAEVLPDSLADLAIMLACSLAALALAEGRTVGLLAEDGRRRLVRPGGGQRQLWRILGELVDAEPTGARPLGELLGQLGDGGSGAALAVITPDRGAAWLAGLSGGRRGAGALALLLAARPGQTAAAAALLAGQGIASQSFALGAALPLASPPRQRVRARVSPLGRVIVERPAP